MKLKERIDADIKRAMLAKDNVTRDILKFIKSEVQRSEGGLKVLDNADIEKMMRTQIENLKITPSKTSEKEIEVLSSYLPSLMTEDQLRVIIKDLIDGNSNIGSIMGNLSKNYKGLVDNKRAMEIAKEELAK
jgi:uncharacterized protein YqeY